MKNRHFRFTIVLGLFSILSISLLQFFWFKKAFSFQKREFEIKVYSALSEVAEEIFNYNGNYHQQSFPVEQLSENYFVVMINDHIDPELLQGLLKRKFQDKDINSDYAYTIYDCAGDNLIYGSGVQSISEPGSTLNLPRWDKDQYYFGVYFPSLQTSLLKGLNELLGLSAILLLVLVFFAFSLFVLFRQKRLSEIQKDFVNNMTHELKTPLSSIKLSSEALLKQENLSESSSKYLEIIAHEAEKLKRQIENVLEQAKGEKDKIDLEKEVVILEEFLKAILDRFNFGRERKVSYQFENEDQDLKLLLDKLHMEHVIHNLLDNVLKYGARSPKLEIKVRRIGRKVLISWKDNGDGIPKKFRKRIFSPFFRIQEGNVHNEKGFGLGLHYVKNVIRAHKGNIRWVTEGDKGYFEIILPIAHA